MADFTIKRHDTLPTLVAKLVQVQDGSETPYPLADGSTVKFNLKRISDGSLVVAGADGSFYDRAEGEVAYNFTAANTEEAGLYEGEFVIVKNGGGRISPPLLSRLLVEIAEDVDNA